MSDIITLPNTSDRLVIANSLSHVNADQWDALTGGHPCLQHAWLHSLEATGCASPATGWNGQHLLLYRDSTLAAALPLYLKTHSRGEYVFDYAWANAWHRYGMAYYPKALGAVPFTPVPGPRLLAWHPADKQTLVQGAIELCRQQRISSLHILFPNDDDRDVMQSNGMLLRQNVQFHWHNHGYQKFDDFLADLNQKNRKKINQARRKLEAEGVHFQWFEGTEISDEALGFFYRCYYQTYLEHGNLPYLSQAFFERIRALQPETLVVVLALRNNTPIAAALNLRGPDALYGRYWGAVEFVSGLHFETCYMQGIKYCIERGLSAFEGGAQGEHKLARGLLPSKTWSAHWIGDDHFRDAIATWLADEDLAVNAYIDELQRHSPYRQAD